MQAFAPVSVHDSKPRNIALHTFCGIETMELPPAAATKRVFLNHVPILCANINYTIYNAEAYSFMYEPIICNLYVTRFL